MNEEKIKNLLKQADQTAGPPAQVKVSLETIQRQAKRRSIRHIGKYFAAAAVILIAAGIWKFSIPSDNTTNEQPPVVSPIVDDRLAQLQYSTERTINLIKTIREQEQRQRRLDVLEAELAAIPDALEEIQKQVDKTAFTLVYSADKMYNELNLTDSAVKTYKRVIELFPENQWAQEARERLETIQNSKLNNDRSEGEKQWQLQNTLS